MADTGKVAPKVATKSSPVLQKGMRDAAPPPKKTVSTAKPAAPAASTASAPKPAAAPAASAAKPAATPAPAAAKPKDTSAPTPAAADAPAAEVQAAEEPQPELGPIAQMQTRLQADGFLAADEVDGIFGSKTEAALMKAQEKYGFPIKDIDGKFGRKTQAALTEGRSFAGKGVEGSPYENHQVVNAAAMEGGALENGFDSESMSAATNAINELTGTDTSGSKVGQRMDELLAQRTTDELTNANPLDCITDPTKAQPTEDLTAAGNVHNPTVTNPMVVKDPAAAGGYRVLDGKGGGSAIDTARADIADGWTLKPSDDAMGKYKFVTGEVGKPGYRELSVDAAAQTHALTGAGVNVPTGKPSEENPLLVRDDNFRSGWALDYGTRKVAASETPDAITNTNLAVNPQASGGLNFENNGSTLSIDQAVRNAGGTDSALLGDVAKALPWEGVPLRPRSEGGGYNVGGLPLRA